MSNLKYKLLLWVVALMVIAIPLYAADVSFWSEDFEATDAADNWTFSSGSDWAIGVLPGTAAAFGKGDATKVLAYDLAGDYANSITSFKYARSAAIDCTDKVGVKLSFDRFLEVEDSHFDKAIIEVSNDGTNWTQVWLNPSKSNGESGDALDYIDDTIDTAWTHVEYDISEVADGQETVYVRFGLSSSAADPFDGWNIDNIDLTESAPDNLYSWTNAQVGTDWNLGAASNGTSWSVGPAVAWPGVDVDSDGELEGGDPGADPAGVAGGTIIGTNRGGAYTINMDPIYLTSPGFDLTGYLGCAVRFQRVLGVLDGAYDEASVQYQIDDDPGTGAFEDVQAWAASGLPVTLVEQQSKVWEVDTAEFYDVTFKLKYDTDGALGTGNDFIIEVSPTGDSGTWTQVFSRNTATDDNVDSGVVTFTSADLPLGFDNGSFFIQARMHAAAGSGSVVISSVKVNGQNWKYAWRNEPQIPAEGVYDEDWTEETADISGADGAESVRVRFALGPTGSFPTKPGGWSLSDVEIIEASREFRPMNVDGPDEMMWGDTGDVTVTLKNTGTATWDDSFSAFEAVGEFAEVTDPGNPIGADLEQLVLDQFAVSRWAVDSIAVDGTVAPDESFDFEATLTAPKLSSVVYAAPFEPTAPADDALSLSHADFALGNTTALADPEAVRAYMEASDNQVARRDIAVTRFPDDAPSTGSVGGWARYYIEELSGAVPFITAGYPPTTAFPKGRYGPAITVDRAAIAVYIQRAAKVPTNYAIAGPDHVLGNGDDTALGSIFYDVPANHWAGMQVQACANAAIVSGYADHTYHPATPVNREAMCKFIVNGVNFAHPGALEATPTMDALEAAGQDAFPFAVDAGGVALVVENDPDTSADERDPLAPFVKVAADETIVFGYPIPAGSPAGTKANFGALVNVTRDQLAVFVWRGFLRGGKNEIFPSVVALGGPGITQSVVGPFTNNEAPFSGFTELEEIVQAGDDATAYITFDAARLNGRATNVPVTFALTEGATATAPHTIQVTPAQIAGWITDLEAQVVQVEPYKTIAWPINTSPTADGGGLDHGIYTLVTTVDGTELTSKPTLKIMGQISILDWEEGIPTTNLEVSGQPGTLDLFGDDADEDTAADWADVIDGEFSVRMVQTQAISFGQDTSNRHYIQLNMDIAGADLTADDTLTVWYSKDSGATWILAGEPIPGDEVPSELDTITFDLPNGLEFTDPEAWNLLTTDEKNDPDNWGADNITGFMVKIGVDLSEAGSLFIDNIELRGT